MLKMTYHTTYHFFILCLNVWNLTHFFTGPKVLEVYKNFVTQYFIQIMEIGSITAYLCMDKLKHTMTYWCAFAQNVNKGVLYMDFQIEELYLTRTQS